MALVKNVFPAVLLLLTCGATAFGQETSLLGDTDGPLSIAWEAVEGAAVYRVEIRRDGSIFIDTETETPELKLDLAPGEYEYRIRVMDPFGNEAAATDWRSLRIQRARTPYFRVKDPLVLWEGDGLHEMHLDVIGINDSLEFVLRKGNVSIPVERVISGEKDTITVNIGGIEPGQWDLYAEAPSNLAFTHPGALTIRPTRPPEIDRLDTDEVFAEGLVPITIEGLSFDEEMTVAFKGPGGFIEIAAIEIHEGEEAVAYLNMTGVQEGSYDLILANPAGEETILKNALAVQVPPDEQKPKVQPRFEIHLGWAPMVIFQPEPGVQLFSIATFETALAFHSGWTKPFINGLGIETRFLFGSSTSHRNSDDSVNFNYMLKADLSGYWRPPVRGKAAPVVILGFGNMWSGYANNFGLKNILFLRFGLGVDFATFSRFTRIGLNFELGFSSDEPIGMVSLMFRRGFRF